MADDKSDCSGQNVTVDVPHSTFGVAGAEVGSVVVGELDPLGADVGNRLGDEAG